MRCSKYIESNCAGIYDEVLQKLCSKKYVLFTGTPCQVNALYNFLSFKNGPTETLYTQSFICHGVGSPAFFRDYLSFMEKRYKSKFVNCKFRAKHFPGKKQDMEILFKNGRTYHAISTAYDLLYNCYLQNFILRKSCFECPFGNMQRTEDITIADFWGYEKIHPKNMIDDISLCIVNTLKGELLLQTCEVSLHVHEYRQKDIGMRCLPKSHHIPFLYNGFWKDYASNGFLFCAKKYGSCHLQGRIEFLLVYCLNKIHLMKAVKKI